MPQDDPVEGSSEITGCAEQRTTVQHRRRQIKVALDIVERISDQAVSGHMSTARPPNTSINMVYFASL